MLKKIIFCRDFLKKNFHPKSVWLNADRTAGFFASITPLIFLQRRSKQHFNKPQIFLALPVIWGVAPICDET